MPNSVWQFEVLRPSASERWWERNDSDCMKNSENADTPMSAIVYTPSPFRLSGKAAQASLRPLRSRSRISTPTLNQKTDSANIKKIANHSGHLELLGRLPHGRDVRRLRPEWETHPRSLLGER